jgi:hypothetical protein
MIPNEVDGTDDVTVLKDVFSNASDFVIVPPKWQSLFKSNGLPIDVISTSHFFKFLFIRYSTHEKSWPKANRRNVVIRYSTHEKSWPKANRRNVVCKRLRE